jgi:hypothetical protein
VRQRHWSVVAVLILGCVLGLVYHHGIEPTLIVEAQAAREQVKLETPTVPKKARRVYRYALVPTGVHSLAEYYEALTDPAVLQAYSQVEVGELHFERLKSPLCGYVAFKREAFVQWTKRCVVIKAGEEVLTDGHHMILARCGNLVSVMPRGPEGSPGVVVSTLEDTFPALYPARPSLVAATPSVGAAAPEPDSAPTAVMPLAPTPTPVGVAPLPGSSCCGGGISVAPVSQPKPVAMADGDDVFPILLVALMLLLAGVRARLNRSKSQTA